MTDKTLSQLTQVASIDTGDLLYVVQDGNSRGAHPGALGEFGGTPTFIAGSGISITTDTGADTVTIASTASQNTFSTITVSGQSNVVADSATDTLTLAAGPGITITTDTGTDTVTIASGGAGAYDGSISHRLFGGL